ncbi:MAG TPA: nitroreductase family protein [Acidimicrobiia bacterium]|nr:nitroreductase family protein [Acidimicrobiia bacterium]
METWDAIRARRNVRAFADEPIPADALERIVEAAWRTPSGSNRQLWAFVLCTDPVVVAGLAETWQGASWVGNAPAAIALLNPKDPDGDANAKMREVMQYDLGQVTMSIMLTATELGVGSGQAGIMNQTRARQVLGFPDDWFCGWVVALGYPADRPLSVIRKPNRKPFEEVVHRDRW